MGRQDCVDRSFGIGPKDSKPAPDYTSRLPARVPSRLILMPTEAHRKRADELAALIPREILPLFDDRFVRSCELIEEYVARLALAAFRSTGLARACAAAVTVDEAVVGAGLVPAIARVPAAWLAATLAARGWLETLDGARYRVARPLPTLDPHEIVAQQEAHDATCLPSYRIAALAAERYPAVLRGEITGEQALFDAEGVSAWLKYFSNANPLYAVSNSLGAIAAEHALPPGGGAVLELGGGFGSGAEALLARLDAAGRGAEVAPYRFTELAPMFLRRAERTLRARFAGRRLEFGALDINRPFAEAWVAPGSYALVYGVNVVHVARDLAATLGEIRVALAAGGTTVLAECVRPFAGRPIYVELVFNLLSAFRDAVLVPEWRPNGGFLTPEQWRAALEANGFAAVEVFPDIATIREVIPQFVVAAISARRT
jgi:SAM-dependent methyltransferase